MALIDTGSTFPYDPAMNLTPQEIRLQNLLKLWVVAFTGTILVFLFAGNLFLSLLNQWSLLLTPSLEPIPLAQEKFWMVLTLSLMFTITYLCYWGQKNIRRNLEVVIPLLISKFASTFFFFIFFVFYQKSLAYLVGVLTDGTVFIITFYCYRQAKNSLVHVARE